MVKYTYEMFVTKCPQIRRVSAILIIPPYSNLWYILYAD